jgi:hypothetical protein
VVSQRPRLSTQNEDQAAAARDTKDGSKPELREELDVDGKALSEIPALKP